MMQLLMDSAHMFVDSLITIAKMVVVMFIPAVIVYFGWRSL